MIANYVTFGVVPSSFGGNGGGGTTGDYYLESHNFNFPAEWTDFYTNNMSRSVMVTGGYVGLAMRVKSSVDDGFYNGTVLVYDDGNGTVIDYNTDGKLAGAAPSLPPRFHGQVEQFFVKGSTSVQQQIILAGERAMNGNYVGMTMVETFGGNAIGYSFMAVGRLYDLANQDWVEDAPSVQVTMTDELAATSGGGAGIFDLGEYVFTGKAKSDEAKLGVVGWDWGGDGTTPTNTKTFSATITNTDPDNIRATSCVPNKYGQFSCGMYEVDGSGEGKVYMVSGREGRMHPSFPEKHHLLWVDVDSQTAETMTLPDEFTNVAEISVRAHPTLPLVAVLGIELDPSLNPIKLHRGIFPMPGHEMPAGSSWMDFANLFGVMEG